LNLKYFISEEGTAKKGQRRRGSEEGTAKKRQRRRDSEEEAADKFLLCKRHSRVQTPPLPLPVRAGFKRGVPHGVPAADKAIAIVPNEKNYQFVFLVFIGFYWFSLRPLRGINSHR
jgi:hypothetical protein